MASEFATVRTAQSGRNSTAVVCQILRFPYMPWPIEDRYLRDPGRPLVTSGESWQPVVLLSPVSETSWQMVKLSA